MIGLYMVRWGECGMNGVSFRQWNTLHDDSLIGSREGRSSIIIFGGHLTLQAVNEFKVRDVHGQRYLVKSVAD